MRFLLIDLPQSNHVSVKYWLSRNGCSVSIFSEAADHDLDSFDAVVIPGVGAFDFAMEHLVNYGIDALIADAIKSEKLIVGICLGMQLIFAGSDEGNLGGLDVFHSAVVRIPRGEAKVPNIGWRSVHCTSPMDSVFGPFGGSKFYFMHGFAVAFDKATEELLGADVLTTQCNMNLLAAFRKENIVGFQFHPEKSYLWGDRILNAVIAHHERDYKDAPHR